MAKPKILDPIQKRDILFGRRKAPIATLLGYARLYIQAGRLSDALDFLEQCPDASDAEWRTLVTSAVETGSSFVLRRSARLRPASVSGEDLRRAAAAAEGLGKWHDALQLRQRAEDAEGIARAAERVKAFRGAGTAPTTPIGKGG